MYEPERALLVGGVVQARQGAGGRAAERQDLDGREADRPVDEIAERNPRSETFHKKSTACVAPRCNEPRDVPSLEFSEDGGFALERKRRFRNVRARRALADELATLAVMDDRDSENGPDPQGADSRITSRNKVRRRSVRCHR
jgi:hypothetical protein